MPASSYPLEELLPHRPPMVLIDEIVSFDETEKAAVAHATIRETWSENWVAIELMAQTAAALAGLLDKADGYTGVPRPGFLLGTRKLTLELPRFEVGQTYAVTAKSVFSDDESASFECAIRCADAVVATATLNAYRPTDLVQFLKQT